jgi:hypothetical protein
MQIIMDQKETLLEMTRVVSHFGKGDNGSSPFKPLFWEYRQLPAAVLT